MNDPINAVSTNKLELISIQLELSRESSRQTSTCLCLRSISLQTWIYAAKSNFSLTPSSIVRNTMRAISKNCWHVFPCWRLRGIKITKVDQKYDTISCPRGVGFLSTISRIGKAHESTLTVIMCNIFHVWIQLLPVEFPLFHLLKASNGTVTSICLNSWKSSIHSYSATMPQEWLKNNHRLACELD